MPLTATSQASILVVSDSPAEAALVKMLLEDDFAEVAESIDPATAVEDFQRHRPGVLLLAFKDLQKSEDYYLGLFRRGGDKSLQEQHRAVVLCTKETVKQAYERCRLGLFDDYVLFWPAGHDSTRLLMSVYCALDEIMRMRAETELAATVAAQTKRLMDLESLLSQQLTRGEEHVASTGRTLAGAEQGIDRALVSLSERVLRKSLEGAQACELSEISEMIDRCRTAAVLPHLQKVSGSLQPLSEWAGGVQEALVPYLESARALGTLAARRRPMILVVDDDEFHGKLIAHILESEGYQVAYAASGGEAMRALGSTRPDLILMDFVMPDMNGIEVLKRIKADPQLTTIPVIMITGNSERDVVVNSRNAGAADFVVKPLDRSVLTAKIARALEAQAR
jgi:CheY-like chemotaxis protein